MQKQIFRHSERQLGKATSKVREEFERDGYVFCPAFAAGLIDDVLVNLQRVVQDCVPVMPAEHVFYEDKSDVSTL